MNLHANFGVSSSYSLRNLGDTKRNRQTDMAMSTRLFLPRPPRPQQIKIHNFHAELQEHL